MLEAIRGLPMFVGDPQPGERCHRLIRRGAVTTLLYELKRRGSGIGVAAMCAGGGPGGAVVIEV